MDRRSGISHLQLKYQLVLLLCIPLSIGIFLFSLLWFRSGKAVILNDINQLLESKNRYYAKIITAFFSEEETLLTTLGGAIEVSDFDNETIFAMCVAAKKNFGRLITAVYIALPNNVYMTTTGWTPPEDWKPADRPWYQRAVAADGIAFTDIYIDAETGNPMLTMSLPIRRNGEITGVLASDVNLNELKKTVLLDEDSKIDGFLIDKAEHFILHKTLSLHDTLTQADNGKYAQCRTAILDHTVVNFSSTINGEPYTFFTTYFEQIGSTLVIGMADKDIFSAITSIRNKGYLFSFIFALAFILLIFISGFRIQKPVHILIGALKNIAEGDGDLTVRLPVIGNEETALLSYYFNQTMDKLVSSIQTVKTDANIMREIGNELAANMTETASAIHQISANIDGVKQQALTQAASVTETAATIEEIVRTIKQLNNSIETQAASVAQSSSSVEQMVANIASIGQTLGKTDGVIQSLTTATSDGKATLVTSNGVTQKIAEESGSLMEASSVIQHIASQTNLLAMNAAIEAAHAGEAGKGFAVVADEIRKLAEESSMQGKAITATLKTLSGEIETLSASSKTVEEKFNAIFTLAEQVKEMSARVTEAMSEQENGSKEVLTAIKNINTVTVEVQAGSEEMLKGGEGVAEEMRKLDDLTRVITESMNEMASGAVQINNAVQEVNGITQKNKQSIQSLASEVSKFKT